MFHQENSPKLTFEVEYQPDFYKKDLKLMNEFDKENHPILHKYISLIANEYI